MGCWIVEMEEDGKEHTYRHIDLSSCYRSMLTIFNYTSMIEVARQSDTHQAGPSDQSAMPPQHLLQMDDFTSLLQHMERSQPASAILTIWN